MSTSVSFSIAIGGAFEWWWACPSGAASETVNRANRTAAGRASWRARFAARRRAIGGVTRRRRSRLIQHGYIYD